jgi:hypothetical protein
MLLWTICFTLGILTVAFAPMVIGVGVKLLSGVGRKFPVLSDVIAIITVIFLGAILICMSGVFAAVYHHMLTGVP